MNCLFVAYVSGTTFSGTALRDIADREFEIKFKKNPGQCKSQLFLIGSLLGCFWLRSVVFHAASHMINIIFIVNHYMNTVKLDWNWVFVRSANLLPVSYCSIVVAFGSVPLFPSGCLLGYCFPAASVHCFLFLP